MSCENCPYNDSCRDSQEEYLWCDKVGGKHFAYGWCGEVLEESTDRQTHKNKKSSRSRQWRRKQSVHKDKRLKQMIRWVGYNPAMGYIRHGFVDGQFVEIKSYVQYLKNSKSKRFYKTYSNKVVRKTEFLKNGNAYRKLFYVGW